MSIIQPDLLSTKEAGSLVYFDTEDIKYFGENQEYRAHRSGLIETRKSKNGQGGLLLEFKPVKTAKYSTDKSGGHYWAASCRWGNKSNPRIHVVICSLFHNKNANKNEVNHIDGNRDNNCADNLEWCTRAENAKNAADRGAFKFLGLGSGLISDDCALLAIVTQLNAGITGQELSRRYGLDRSIFAKLRNLSSPLAKKYYYIFNHGNTADRFGADLAPTHHANRIRKKPG